MPFPPPPMPPAVPPRHQALRTACWRVGLSLGALGVLGLIPGVGPAVFRNIDVTILHNLLYLGSGVAGLAMSRTVDGARSFLFCGGGLYLLLFAYGVVVDDAGGVAISGVGNWLHLGVGIVLIALGSILGGPAGRIRRSGSARTTPTA